MSKEEEQDKIVVRTVTVEELMLVQTGETQLCIKTDDGTSSWLAGGMLMKAAFSLCGAPSQSIQPVQPTQSPEEKS